MIKNTKIKIILSALLGLSLIVGGTVYFFKKSKPVEVNSATEKELPTCPKIILGVVSDIHAGGEKIRKADSGNHTYPNRYKDFFPAVLEKMKTESVNLVLTAGDNTHKGVHKYAENLQEIAREKNMEVIWTKGNHDKNSANAMAAFGLEKNYYVDKCDYRFIILNSCEDDANGIGGISAEQLNWLKTALETDKKIIIGMHHPIWDKKNNKEIIYPKYRKFEKIISASGKVKHIFSGHTHTENWDKTHNGIEYHAVPALSLGREDFTHKVIHLE